MPLELSKLKQLPASEGEPTPDVEAAARQQLLDRIRLESASSRRTSGRPKFQRRFPYRLRIAAVGTAALFAVGGAILYAAGRGAPSITGRAYAAISPANGIMHFVVEHKSSATDQPFYEEYWIDLADPSKRRIVQTVAGRVTRQIVYVGGASKTFEQAGSDHNPITVITHAPPQANPRNGADPNTQGFIPVIGYREMLHSGKVKSESATTVDGHAAYKLVIDANGTTVTYVVDRQTYFPLAFSSQIPGSPQVLNTDTYPMFEIVSSSPEAAKLLQPADPPRPYLGSQ
jgi:hypothetical protein